MRIRKSLERALIELLHHHFHFLKSWNFVESVRRRTIAKKPLAKKRPILFEKIV
jgi:hypothetical protein